MCRKSKDCGKTKYVQGGLQNEGDGSKKKPYNSLVFAQQDKSWETLVVLPSQVPLDFGIKMRPGTKLIGESCNGNKPIITNTSSESNNGFGVIAHGNVTIKNIHIKDTWSSAINYSNSCNLSVCNVLITGYNQGSVVLPFSYLSEDGGSITGIYAPAIYSSSEHHSKAKFRNVHIKDNALGMGILDNALNGAKHYVTVKKCEFSNLIQSVPVLPEIFDGNIAVFALAQGKKSESVLKVSKSSFHDFRQPNIFGIAQTSGIRHDNTSGGKSSAHICKNSFKNLNTLEEFFAISFTVLLLGYNGESNLVFERNTVDEKTELDRQGVQFRLYNCTSNIVIRKNVMKLFNAIWSNLSGENTNVLKIYDNDITCTRGITLSTESTFSDTSIISQNALICKNNIETIDGIGLYIVSNIFGEEGLWPWTKLRVNGINNCISSDNEIGNGVLIELQDIGNDSIVDLHSNNITGYFYEYVNFQNQGVFNFQNNWWTNGSANGFNVGSATIIDQPVLSGPIVCPKNGKESCKPCSKSDKSLSKSLLNQEEFVQKIRNEFKNRNKLMN